MSTYESRLQEALSELIYEEKKFSELEVLLDEVVKHAPYGASDKDITWDYHDAVRAAAVWLRNNRRKLPKKVFYDGALWAGGRCFVGAMEEFAFEAYMPALIDEHYGNSIWKDIKDGMDEVGISITWRVHLCYNDGGTDEDLGDMKCSEANLKKRLLDKLYCEEPDVYKLTFDTGPGRERIASLVDTISGKEKGWALTRYYC